MKITLKNIAKRFNKEWIFREVSTEFLAGSNTGIIGSNGSGKSTLIKLISAAELPSKGTISYQINNNDFDTAEVFSLITYAAPYIDIIEEFTCIELVEFHMKFKPFQNGLTETDFLDLLYLKDAKNKLVKNFSSGMKQRLKLGLAICSESELLLLDEPCSNLDSKGILLYHQLLKEYNKNRTTVIGSNEEADELFQTEKTIRISNYK